MRSKLYISLVVLALLCFVAWTGHGQRTRSGWEYRVDPVPDVGTDRERSAEADAHLINQRAAEGWELAAVGGSNYYFKRAR
jgi:hypothetical protein